MIILHGFGTRVGLPGLGLLVTRTKVRLKMAYRTQQTTRPSWPRGQLSYTDESLRALQRAPAWVLERMIDHYVDWALAGARWVKPENFAKGASPDAGH